MDSLGTAVLGDLKTKTSRSRMEGCRGRQKEGGCLGGRQREDIEKGLEKKNYYLDKF